MNTNLRFCLALHHANASLQLKLDNELGLYHGISFNDFVLLHWLAQADSAGLGLAPLAQSLGQSPSAVLRQLILLEKIGLVAREGSTGGRQAVLRPAGRAVFNTARETAERLCTEAVESIAAAPAAMLGNALERFAHSPSLASG